MSESNLLTDAEIDQQREKNRSINFLGYEIRRKPSKKDKLPDDSPKKQRIVSVVPPMDEDEGGYVTTSAGHYGQVLDVRGDSAKTDRDLLVKYRNAAVQPECDSAIEDIVNEVIVADDENIPVSLNLDAIEDEILDDKTKEVIIDEFKTVISLLDFRKYGHDIFRRWYIDGRIIYHKVIDLNNPTKGVQEVRPINPIKIQKVKEILEKQDEKTSIALKEVVDEYFLFSENGFGSINNSNISSRGHGYGSGDSGIKLSKDSVSYITSGMTDASRRWPLSHLHKALKLVNQLRMMEDALVIYRLARAPERRLFSIDISGMNEKKGMEYVTKIMNTYRNKIVYDAKTGEVQQDSKHMSMLEDFWIPTREGSKGAQITNLAGGCLSMDTKVSLLDGRELSISNIEKEIKEGKELWTYSCHPTTGKIVPGLISWAGVTQKQAKVMKIVLDNGKEIICTPDHKFPVYQEDFKRADAFKVGDSFIPLYKDKKPLSPTYKKEYEAVFDNEIKEWIFTHRLVGKFLKDKKVNYEIYNENLSNGKYDVLHHKNHNRLDNNPNNLSWMSWDDHRVYHSENMPENFGLLGTKAAAKKIKKEKELNSEWYQNFIKNCSENSKNFWNSLSKEEKEIQCHKISESVSNWFSTLSDEQKQTRAKISSKNAILATAALQKKLKNSEEFKENFVNNIKKSWTKEKRKERAKLTKKLSSERWNDKKLGDELRKNHKEKQKVVINNVIMTGIIDLIKNKTTHQVTVKDVVTNLNNDLNMVQELIEINKEKNVPNLKSVNTFSSVWIKKAIQDFGYKSWKHLRMEHSNHNHKIVSIEYLHEEIEVGTLRIDDNHEFHDYHTFALSAGIFTKNSNLGEIDDIVYFQKKLYKSLNVPVSRLDNETGISIGRTQEISRDELKFQKFVNRLRTRFGELFKDILKTQLLLKQILSLKDWDEIKENIIIDYAKDSFFSELKDAEMLRERLTSLEAVQPHVGKWFSEEDVFKNILKKTDEQIKETRRQLYDEAIRRRTEIKLPQEDNDSPGNFAPTPGGPPGGPDSVNIPGSTDGNQSPAVNAPDTGLGGINDVPLPPGGEQPEGTDQNDDAKISSNANEPEVNPDNAQFPSFGDEDEDNDKNRQQKQKRPENQ